MRGHKFSNISSLFKLSETYRAELFQSGGFINGSLHLVSKLRVPVAKKMIFNSFFQGHKVFWKIGRPFAHSLHVSYLWSFICLALLGYCHSTWWSSWRVGEGGSFSRHGQQLYGGHIIVLVVDYLERVKSSKTFQVKNILVDLKLFFLLSLYYVLFCRS